MTVYALAQLTITDRDSYGRYQARFLDVLNRFGGRVLAADERPSVEEGSWEHDKVVLLEFPDERAFRTFSDSPEYREIAVDRTAGSHGPVLLIHGIGHAPEA
ncbi:DUF1330 domain-containing protein [Nocardia sp. CDC159]|uniref:DUF1330 domain-containing protein n=1 Tax=Nocardia pulmonis TaxID=2951408 RepID=A0A9X2IVT1_9NOCA|nr:MULTISPECIES: DUF1330 domain-containing protein [Nocardia]MCM6773558.1 DUF1330 domain-containing protein [Nocardia pulmonis]MCM6786445.1 DUF1330 domain-containing protein [Nocardia sp. CDC159]